MSDRDQTIAARLGGDQEPGWGRLVPGAEVRVGPPPVPRKAAKLPDAPAELYVSIGALTLVHVLAPVIPMAGEGYV